MLREVGFCSGIENYSRILDGRPPGARPYCLLDYFPKDWVCFIDESHQTVPQIGGMYEGDQSRKRTLVEYGFRLPSALDNRPQTFEEFLDDHAADGLRVGHARHVRAREVARDRRADRAADGDRRPRGRRARDAQPDRRPDERDPRAGRPRRARAGHHAHEEDERGPDRLPARDGLQGPLPALGDRHAGAHPDHPRAAARRVRRARRREPAARGPGPARGVAGRRSSTPTRRASCAARPR